MHIYLVALKSMIFTSFSVYKLTTIVLWLQISKRISFAIVDNWNDFWVSMKTFSAVPMLSVSAEESWHVITQINT